MAKTICFFNNKGGVGKTTTACNIAASLAQRFNKKVLVVDLDPQCNSTLLIEGDEYFTAQLDMENGGAETIMSVVEPLLLDEPRISFKKSVIEKRKNRFSVHVLMGHPKLSLIEDRLGEAWGKIAGGDVGAFRKTNWCNSLISKLRPDYDYIFIDLGPSLGALNRSALIATDYFVTPMSIDIFSLIGLRNISEWIREWSERYAIGVSNFKTGPYASKSTQFDINEKPNITNGFIGYTTQAYISTKTQSAGVKRPTKAFEKILSRFESEFNKDLGSFFKPELNSSNLILGQIPNMFGLAPLAQSSNAPVRSLKASDGVFGQHYYQVEKFKLIFDEIADNLISNAGISDD